MIRRIVEAIQIVEALEAVDAEDEGVFRNFTRRPRLKVCTRIPRPPLWGVRTPWLLRELATIWPYPVFPI